MHASGQLTLESVVMQNPDQLATQFSGDTVLMSLQTGRYYGMRAAAGRIWDLLRGPRTVASVCEALLEEYSVDRDRCEREVLAFLGDLATEDLLVRLDEGTAPPERA
jgi:hypothetical protein